MRNAVELLLKAAGYLELLIRDVLVHLPPDIRECACEFLGLHCCCSIDMLESRTVGPNKVAVSVKTGAQVVYSKYAGNEVEFSGSNHLILKEDDIVGILDTDDVKDLKPLNDRVLIKV